MRFFRGLQPRKSGNHFNSAFVRSCHIPVSPLQIQSASIQIGGRSEHADSGIASTHILQIIA